MEGQAPSRQQVIDLIKERWTPERRTETVQLTDALGRVIAQEHHALYNQPVVRSSAMDGIAVDSARFADGMPDTSKWVSGREFVRADTGDDFDDAYDAVIPIERVEILEGGGITIDATAHGTSKMTAKPLEVVAGLNVRPAGSSMRQGELLVPTGTRLTATDLAVLAAGGMTEVEVRRRPCVAFIPTGSELVPLGQAPARGKTIDSNSVLVEALLTGMGARTMLSPIIRDDPAALTAALDAALEEADIVLINAGSSKGGEDFNARLLEERGEVLCHWIAAAPGRPLAAAIIDGKPVITVPGPPLSTYHVMEWCAKALVAYALDIEAETHPTVTASLESSLRASPDMQVLRRLDLRKTTEGYAATVVSTHQATLPRILASPAQFINELGDHNDLKQGDTITVELLRNEAYI
jgi:molybdopterin molybdotransferase/putative molybdopterin biosynthesis protein